VGDYRWHRARALPVIASMHCHFCFTYNYHQKWPRTGKAATDSTAKLVHGHFM